MNDDDPSLNLASEQMGYVRNQAIFTCASRNAARNNKKTCIILHHLQLAIRNDKELNKSLHGVTVMQSNKTYSTSTNVVGKKSQKRQSEIDQQCKDFSNNEHRFGQAQQTLNGGPRKLEFAANTVRVEPKLFPCKNSLKIELPARSSWYKPIPIVELEPMKETAHSQLNVSMFTYLCSTS